MTDIASPLKESNETFKYIHENLGRIQHILDAFDDNDNPESDQFDMFVELEDGVRHKYRLMLIYHDILGKITTPEITIEGYPDSVPENATIYGSEYYNYGSTSPHSNTDWIILDEDGNEVWSSMMNYDRLTEITLDYGILEKNKTYTVKVRYTCTNTSSPYGELTFSTKENFVTITPPVVNISGYPYLTPECATVYGSAFTYSPTEYYVEEHASTDYIIIKVDTGETVWEYTGTGDELLETVVPRGILEPDTSYQFGMRYNGANYNSSEWSYKTTKTTADFSYVETPELTVEGALIDEVPENPLLQASEFSVHTSTYEEDTHRSTDWVITDTSGNTVWSSTGNTTDLYEITVPEGYLQAYTDYIFKVRFRGTELGYSDYAEVTGKTLSVFHYPKTPAVYVIEESEGTPEQVDLSTVFGATEFEYYQDDTNVYNHEWEIYLATDTDFENPVYTFSGTNILTLYPNFIPEPSTDYVVRYRYQTSDLQLWSSWANLNIRTVDEFTYPSIKFTMKDSITLTEIVSFWDSNTFSVYVNDALHEGMTTSYNLTYDLSSDGDQIEIRASDNIYPMVNFNGNSNLISIDAPLPQMRSTKSEDPITYFTNPMCYNCTSLTSLPDFLFAFNPDLKYMGVCTDNATVVYGMFQNCNALTSLPQYLFSGLVNLEYMGSYGSSTSSIQLYGVFQGCSRITSLPSLFISSLPSLKYMGGYASASTGAYVYGVFENCTNITALPEKLFNNLSALEVMGGHAVAPNYAYTYGVFSGCVLMSSVDADVFNYLPKLRTLCGVVDDTSSTATGLAYTYGLFHNCQNIADIDPYIFYDFTKLTDVTRTFYGCLNLTPTVYFSADNIVVADYFAHGTSGTGTVYLPTGSVSYETFTSATSTGVNVSEY